MDFKNIHEKKKEIDTKYETYKLIDMDVIQLFNLTYLKITETYNKKTIKKNLTKKYHSLLIQYHPDKIDKNETTTIDICDINIDKNIIYDGILLAFINDIYKFLLEIIDQDIDLFVNFIKEPLEYIYGESDFNELKKNNKIKINATNSEFNNEKIVDTKLTNDEIKTNLDKLVASRDNLEIENIFKKCDTKSLEFKDIFNKKFNEDRSIEPCTDITPFHNDEKGSLDSSFKLINVDLTTKISDKTLEQIIEERAKI